MDKENGGKCFIITPIGDENSDVFRKAKGVIESVIKIVLQQAGFLDIKAAYEITESGMIGNQIVERIINDDLVIANLTGNNPNVMYELAIRHASAKPIIHICESGTVLPFDIKDGRTIFYKDDMYGTQELRGMLKRFVEQVDYLKEYKDNPIYNAMRMSSLFREMDNEGRQSEADILQKILYEISELKTNKGIVETRNSNNKEEFFGICIESNRRKEWVEKFFKELSQKIIIIRQNESENEINVIARILERKNIKQVEEFINNIANKYGLKIKYIIPARMGQSLL